MNHVNEGVMFGPGIKIGRPPVLTAEELVEGALRDLVTISEDHGDPLVKAQAVMFRKRLAAHQVAWMKRAADNEREVIRNWLVAHGFRHAAEAL